MLRAHVSNCITETRETILHDQLQEGLRIEIMNSPSVSGALVYKELVLIAKNEGHRLSEMRKRQDCIHGPSNQFQ